MGEACPKCGDSTKMRLQVSLFAPYRPKGSGVEQKWPLTLAVCQNCGYAESFVEKEDIPSLRRLSEKQRRLAESRVQALR